MALTLAVFALLRWQAAMIAAATCGLLLLFALYLRQIGLPRRDVVVATVVGAGLGVGWALIAGPIVTAAYRAALGSHTDLSHVLFSGVAIPITQALLMVVPAIVVWVLNRCTRKALSGYALGALGAVVFDRAAAIALLVPQLALGVTARDQSVAASLGEAAVEGIAWPLASLATGGIFGIALWTTFRDNPSRRRRTSLAAATAVLLGVMIAMGLVDIAPLSLPLYITLQLLIAALAMVVLRHRIAAALLHEVHDGTSDDGQTPCAECDHVAAATAFCTECGVATAARPATVPAVSYPRVLAPLAAGLGVVALAAVSVAMLITPATRAFVCPPDCGRPPLGTPVENNPRFSSDDGAFSVAYPAEEAAYKATFDPPGLHGVEVRYIGGDTGSLALFGEPARGRTPKQIVWQAISGKYPEATLSYEIPNASVGYQPGYGAVADVYARDSAASYTRLRVIVMAAVKHDYALIAAAVGPYHVFSPDYGNGQPSGANLELAMDIGKYVNSFRWGGDRYGPPT
ncbi:MAG: zinc ribbon domain-containing protein [Mycobacterium sp.]|nr:zinc ribbon domain-containing protein [Mycobacterium sp.]